MTVDPGHEAIVRFAGVTKRYPGQDVAAVDRVDIDITEGEFFSLLGPSGSGKTSSLRMIAGFEAPTEGRIFIAGLDVSDVPAHRRDVNTVFQNYALFPHMTVARNVGYPLKMRKVPRVESDRRVEAALAGVEMESMADRLPHQLSGGQRQRVALARALVGRPKVLLLDEPLGALDLHLRQQMQTMLKQLQRDVGITFVYVTHDQGEALSMSDRLAVMNQGRIEQVGQPRDVYHRPATRFVAGFIGKTNLLTLDVRDGTTTLAGRRFPVPAAPTSGSTTFSLRHEAVRVGGRPQGDGWVELSGVVAEVSFLGDSQEVAVVVDGQVIVAREAATTSESLGHGSTTTLTFRPADLVAVGD